MNVLSERHVRALRSIRRLWPGKSLVVVGGLAVAHHTRMPWRTTQDLDLAIGIEMEEFPGNLHDAPDWRPDPDGLEHCKLFEEHLRVDFLPVGQRALERTQITWPVSGRSMTVIGFDLAFRHCMEVEIEEDVKVAIADLPVVALLKMVAFLDRPTQRTRDLEDILEILRWNEGVAGDRLFEERILKMNLPVDEAAAFLMGADVAAIADDRSRGKIQDFLDLVQGGYLDLAAIRTGMDPELAERLYSAMKRGLSQDRAER